MSSAIWKVSGRLIIPLYPELTEKQANEEGNLRSICDLLPKNVPWEWTHGTHMDKKQIAKLFETEWPNGCMDEEKFCTDAVKQMHGWGKLLHRCSQTGTWMQKIVAQMQSNRYMDAENFCTDAVKQIDDWWKFLNGCGQADELLTKIFKRMRASG